MPLVHEQYKPVKTSAVELQVAELLVIAQVFVVVAVAAAGAVVAAVVAGIAFVAVDNHLKFNIYSLILYIHNQSLVHVHCRYS